MDAQREDPVVVKKVLQVLGEFFACIWGDAAGSIEVA